MGSTRLPGKVLKDLGGATVLARVVSRVRRCRSVNEVVVATSTNPDDDMILDECRRLQVRTARGSEHDVLDRYYRAALEVQGEVIVRITSDCPLIDWEVTDRTIQLFEKARPDYASNTLARTYPRGLDTEVTNIHALGRAWREASEPYQRVHVTPYLYQNPNLFRLLVVKNEIDCSGYRWTLDTPEDLAFLRAVYSRFANRRDISWLDVLDLMKREPELAEINRTTVQKNLHEG